MQVRNFVASSSVSISTEASLQLYSAPKADREPVKIIVIGSKTGVNTIVNALHQRRFAEVPEWTDFLPVPEDGSGLTLQAGEVMKVLVKYLPIL
ncbi:MAG: hypothetical protein AAF329_05560 [Cyanobacteria bacterium P01_A01_bin.17]